MTALVWVTVTHPRALQRRLPHRLSDRAVSGPRLSGSRVVEDVFAGAPPQAKPYAQAESDIQTRFREFLDRDEMAHTATPGVPTRAARRGVNHRLKIKKGNPRPSFIDTGAYQGAFLAWVDES